MKKTALIKDFYREILNNKGRFLSILLIVALGVAFFSGIRSAEPDMRLTGDKYFDNNLLYDGKVMGTLGLDDEDLEAIAGLDLVESAEGEHNLDVLCMMDGRDRVLHVMSLPEIMNTVRIEKGRMPEKPDECILDAELLGEGFREDAIRIGDKISFSSGDAQEITENMKTDTYTVVGFCSTPVYLSFSRGTTSIGTGEVYGYAYVPDEAFTADYYSAIYYRVKGAAEFKCFSQQYLDLMEEAEHEVASIEKEQCEARYRKLYGDGEKEINDAQKKLDDAKKELDDGRKEISDGKKELADGEKKLTDARNELEKGRKDAREELRTAEAKLIAAQKELESGRWELDQGWNQLNAGKAELAEKEALFNQGKAEYEKNLLLLEQMKQALQEAQEDIPLLEAGIAQAEQKIGELEAYLAYLEQQVPRPEEEIAAVLAALETARAGKADLETKLAEAQAAVMQLPGQIALLEEGLEKARTELDEAEALIAYGKQALQESEAVLMTSEEEYKKGQAELAAGWNSYYAGKKEADAKLADGERQIADGEKEIRDNRKKLADGEKELRDGEKEVSENQGKVDDARRELNDLEMQEWYSLDRMDDTDYAEFDDNALRMRKIGQVFPVIFFLVAALISLTTMTRMVEEQRIQIGTMKALGYPKRAVMGKYTAYAGSATVIGSLIGIIVGEKTLPNVIITAYGIMYHYMNEKEIPLNWYYGLLAAGAAIICVLAATLAACHRELQEVPARLMLPPSPKSGKRVFAERIGFLWRRLNFSWKATVRNLTRYKKRLLMTIFGIGGSMALVLAGFGLQDSIMEVVTLQYEDIQLYDADVYLKDTITDGQRRGIEDVLREEVGEDAYMQAYLKSMDLTGSEDTTEVYLMVPQDPEKMKNFVNFRNRITHEPYELTDTGVILTEKGARLSGVKTGDTVTLDDGDGNTAEVTVEAICEHYMHHYVYMTPALYESLFGKTPKYNDFMVSTAAVVPDGADAEETKSVNDAVGEKILDCDGVMNISYLINLKSRLDDMLSTLDIVIFVLILSAGLLSFVVLYNLNNINITERRRELATIKVLGFRDTELAMYVYRENIILTIVGILLGLILGFLLHRFLITTVEIDTVMFGRKCAWYSYVYSILITGAFSAVVNWIMYFKLKKISMVESLKSVE